MRSMNLSHVRSSGSEFDCNILLSHHHSVTMLPIITLLMILFTDEILAAFRLAADLAVALLLIHVDGFMLLTHSFRFIDVIERAVSH